jgi:hypothetical protein
MNESLQVVNEACRWGGCGGEREAFRDFQSSKFKKVEHFLSNLVMVNRSGGVIAEARRIRMHATSAKSGRSRLPKAVFQAAST